MFNPRDRFIFLPGTVTTDALADGSVTTAKLAANSVTATKIANDAIDLTKTGIEVLKGAEVEIATAAVLTLFGTPVQLVAAPGAGYYLEFVSATFWYDYNSVAYAVGAGDDLAIKFTNASGVQVSSVLETTGFLTATSDQVRHVVIASGNYTPAENAALVLHCLNANPTLGNSPVKVRTLYRRRAYTW